MVFQGLDKQQADAVWQPFLDWVAESPRDFTIPSAARIAAVPARNFWDPEFLRKNLPDMVLADSRPGAPLGNVFWKGNLGESGQFLYGYESAWLPASLLKKDRQTRLPTPFLRQQALADHAPFQQGPRRCACRSGGAAKDTAMNPAVLDAFALAISASSGPPAYPGIPGHEPDLSLAASMPARSPRRWRSCGSSAQSRVLRVRGKLLRQRLAALLLGPELPETRP